MQRVRRRATDNRDLVIDHRAQPSGAREPAECQHERSISNGGFMPGPKPDKWAEGEGETKSIGGSDSHHGKSLSLAAEHPFPGFECVEPAQRLTGRSAGGL